MLRASVFCGGDGGFSLIELLIAMLVGLVVLGAAYGVFTIQNKTFANQEDLVEMQQNVRVGLDIMTREIGMAGYNPLRVNFNGVTYDTSQLQIQADITDDSGDDPDGDTNDQNENIVYKYYDGNSEYPYQIRRKVGSGYFLPFIENVDAFTFDYRDSAGTTTTVSANIRQIRITVTGRTARPDPDYPTNGGYRTYTLTSIVAPRNLAY